MSAPVPFMDLRRLTREIAGGFATDAADIARAADFVGGPRVDALECALAAKFGAPHVVACANGTDALVLALLAAGVHPGDVVAIPALTFWATYEAVITVGAQALLIDCDDDLQMDAGALRDAWHLRAPFRFAILAHLFGWTSARLGYIRDTCFARNITLIEDGAQAFGVAVTHSRGQIDIPGSVPSVGGVDESVHAAAFSTLSFYPAKVFGGPCDGGAVTCASAEHAAVLRSLRNHGRAVGGGYAHERAGVNSRMSSLAAAYLLRVLAMSDRILASRRAALAHYVEAIDGKRGFRVHMPPPGVTGNGYLCVVTHETHDGDTLAERLRERGVGCARTYPATIADQPGARGVEAWGDLARARGFCRRVVNLPLFYGITTDEQDAAIAALMEAV